MKFRHLLTLLFVSIFFSGCASSLTPADKARIRRVGVVSLVGDTVRGSYVGLTVFNNTYYDAPVPDFALDRIFEEESTRAIGSGAVALPMEREPLRSVSQVSGLFSGPLPYEMSRADGVIRSIAAQRKLDAVAVWTPTVFEDHGMRLRGASLAAGLFGKKMGGGIHASMQVFDGITGKRLAWNTGDGAATGVLDIRWRDKFEEFTPEEREAIRAHFQLQARTKAATAPRYIGIAR